MTTTPSIDTNCSSYRPFYQSLSAFNDYKSAKLNTDALGNYISSTLGSDLAGTTPNVSVADMQMNVQTNLTTLQNLERSAYQMMRCLQSEITQRSERAGEIYSLQERLTAEEKAMKVTEETSKEAKERANLLESPYSKTTRHQLWFPLGRPLKAESVPVLLSIAIIFLVLSLGMFLRLATIDVKFSSPLFAYFGSQSGYGRGFY